LACLVAFQKDVLLVETADTLLGGEQVVEERKINEQEFVNSGHESRFLGVSAEYLEDVGEVLATLKC
jgi:hypothetical protein